MTQQRNSRLSIEVKDPGTGTPLLPSRPYIPIPMRALTPFLEAKDFAGIQFAARGYREEVRQLNPRKSFGLSESLPLPVNDDLNDLGLLFHCLRTRTDHSARVFSIPSQLAGKRLRDLTNEELIRALNAGMLTNELLFACLRFPHCAKLAMERPRLKKLLPAEAVTFNSYTRIKNALTVGATLALREAERRPAQFLITVSLVNLIIGIQINPAIKQALLFLALVADHFIGNKFDTVNRSIKAGSFGMFIGHNLKSVADVASTVEQKPRNARGVINQPALPPPGRRPGRIG